jgi:indolepyruvate ferredoxin oxidoreductase beta subunit
VKEPYSILVAGVGGQGNLVYGRIVAEASVYQGLRPVVGDTFGASRRGGSVLTHIRIGKQDWGPLIPEGEVDILIGFEPLEALRAAIKYAGARTVALVSAIPVPPSNVTSGSRTYPKIDDIRNALDTLCKKAHFMDPEPVMNQAKSTRVLNTYMMGVLSTVENLPIEQDNLRKAISKILDSSKDLEAFDQGVSASTP